MRATLVIPRAVRPAADLHRLQPYRPRARPLRDPCGDRASPPADWRSRRCSGSPMSSSLRAGWRCRCGPGPALGGLVLGLFAVAFPQILGSGHGGILHVSPPARPATRCWLLIGLDPGEARRLGGVDRQRLSRRHVQLVAVSRRPVRRRLLADRRIGCCHGRRPTRRCSCWPAWVRLPPAWSARR